ncbi:MAG: hypothetical protein D6822_08815 [Cyanobacteria bacterium J149]|nr:MAG: hypothetical protein D6822_08815 [Cyanobacteria bacterium J149]
MPLASHLWQQATLASPPFVTGFANNKGENIIYMSLPEEDNIMVREITLPDIFSNKFDRLDNQGQKKQLLFYLLWLVLSLPIILVNPSSV